MKKENYEAEVLKYFSDKAEGYDDVEKQTYWQLSDKLLWHLLTGKINELPKKFKFLDAGGGTGRWSKKILENYPDSEGTLVDLSPDMLKQAKNKNIYCNRWKIIKGDLQKLDLQNEMFDLVINTHNVLGFVKDAQKAINEMSRVLKKQGLLISVIPNKYHAIFFNIFQSNIDEAESINEKNEGRFVYNMPLIDMFSPKSISEKYETANLSVINTIGFPVSIYPGFQETQLKGETKKTKNIIEEHFERLFELEKELIQDETTCARGNNLFIVGKKL